MNEYNGDDAIIWVETRDPKVLEAFKLKDIWLESQDPEVFRSAISILEALLSSNNVAQRKELLTLAALLLHNKGDFDQAVPYYKELADLEPDSECANSDLFHVSLRAGRTREATDLMEDFLASHPVGEGYIMCIEDQDQFFRQWVGEVDPADYPHIMEAISKFSPHCTPVATELRIESTHPPATPTLL